MLTNLKKINTLIAIIVFSMVAISVCGQAKLERLQSLYDNRNFEEVIEQANLKDTLELAMADRARFLYLLGSAYGGINSEDKELFYLIKSRDNYKEIDSTDQVDKISIQIIRVLASNSLNIEEVKKEIEYYLDYASKQKNTILLRDAYMQLGRILYVPNPKEALKYFYKAFSENEKMDDDLYEADILSSLGVCYATDAIMKPDSSLVMYERAYDIYKRYNKDDNIAKVIINRGVAYFKKEEYDKSLQQYYIADTFDIKENRKLIKSYIQFYLGNTYKAMGDYENALNAYEKEKTYLDSLNIEDQQTAIKDIETKYKTKEKELENQKLAGEVKVKNIVLFAISGLLVLLLVIGFLVINYISKKRKIAEQEKTIESQKMETLLREQELHEIDVMLESQEKERQRIANDLHDNLGSLLSALKLNFNILGKKEREDGVSKKLYEKTEELINETYVQVRNISHLKNLGVVGNEGLLVAVKKMAEKMSVINRLQFKVIPFGLNERLESNLEITLFRMIQELSSNIIKHSEATEVTIYLTQHHNHQLNVMIEDNGKGFDTAALKDENTGIGLKNIEKKVEQLGGTFTIDSMASKGTTIIIDIPL